MNIERRLERIEKELKADSKIPETERIIVIPFWTEEEFERLKKEKIDKLQEKYGPKVSTDDLMIVALHLDGSPES